MSVSERVSNVFILRSGLMPTNDLTGMQCFPTAIFMPLRNLHVVRVPVSMFTQYDETVDW